MNQQQQQTSGQALVVQGRIVWTGGNSVFEGSQKKTEQGQVILDENGQPKIVHSFGLAIPKSSLQSGQVNQALWGALQQEALAIFPSGVPKEFAWKYKDGDTDVDHKGQPFNLRKGYAGCLVLTCSTEIAPKFFRWENNSNVQINDGIKCGDYVEVALTIKGHPAKNVKQKPGLYLNPNAVRFLAYGEEIVNGPSADTMFGSAAPVSTIGGSATPIGVATQSMPSFGSGTPQFQQQTAPVQPPQYGMPPAGAVTQPHHGVLPPQFQQQTAPVQPPQYGMPPAGAVTQMPGGFPPIPGAR